MTIGELQSILKGFEEYLDVEYLVKIPERDFGFFAKPYGIRFNDYHITIELEEWIPKGVKEND